MAVKILKEGFTFDDVLIRPGASKMEPAEASLKTNIAGIELSVPFLSAAMDRVTEEEMAIALGKLGGLCVIHRNCSIEVQVKIVEHVKEAGVKVAAACGPFAADRAKALDEAGCDAIVIDCAHGHNLNVVESARKIKKSLKNSKMIFGNIATGEGGKSGVQIGRRRKSRRRTGKHLHHPPHFGRGRAAALGSARCRIRRPQIQSTRHRRRRHPHIGGYRQGSRCGS